MRRANLKSDKDGQLCKARGSAGRHRIADASSCAPPLAHHH